MKKTNKKTNLKNNVERNPHFDAQTNLLRKAKDLVAIVEGAPSLRWVSGNLRLKDTHEWAAFYVAVGEVR